MPLLSNQNVSIMIKDLSVIVGELAGFFGCKAFAPYLYDDKGNTVECKDFHFFNNCPLKEKNELGVVLFSILCIINYATVFIENFFFTYSIFNKYFNIIFSSRKFQEFFSRIKGYF